MWHWYLYNLGPISFQLSRWYMFKEQQLICTSSLLTCQTSVCRTTIQTIYTHLQYKTSNCWKVISGCKSLLSIILSVLNDAPYEQWNSQVYNLFTWGITEIKNPRLAKVSSVVVPSFASFIYGCITKLAVSPYATLQSSLVCSSSSLGCSGVNSIIYLNHILCTCVQPTSTSTIPLDCFKPTYVVISELLVLFLLLVVSPTTVCTSLQYPCVRVL